MQTPTTHPSLAASFAQADTQPAPATQPALPPGTVVLPPLGAPVSASVWHARANTVILFTHDNGYIAIAREYGQQDVEWPSLPCWHGHEHRRGSDGNKWSCTIHPHVMDDFGFLVPVGGAA